MPRGMSITQICEEYPELREWILHAPFSVVAEQMALRVGEAELVRAGIVLRREQSGEGEE